MQQPGLSVNSLAPLVNVSTLHAAAKRNIDRKRHLTGIVGFYGYAGWGKTSAAAFVANALDAVHVEIKDYWDKRTFFEQICIELGIDKYSRDVATMGGKIAERLIITQQLLIIDEFDFAVKYDWVDLVRGLYESSKAPIIVIGEDILPKKLKRWERFHSRVREWVPAHPADIDDCRTLVNLYREPGLEIAEDLLLDLHAKSGGSCRRITNNVEALNEFAAENALDRITLASWNKQFDTGNPPPRTTPPRGKK